MSGTGTESAKKKIVKTTDLPSLQQRCDIFSIDDDGKDVLQQ